MAVRSLSGVRASEVNPSFLHANSTSHTWIFSAIAELIDNAYDPDVAATQLWIEKRMINGQVTLVFVDNGNGMSPDRLHKMLSFGFSDKQEIRGHRPIGQYGNGFKSGSMRLGKDVLVFTRQRGTMSVGFLSQTYLQAINAKTVFVPIATWRLPSNQMVQTQECYSSLKEILRHSIFRTERSIIQELDALGCIGHSGTEIIIYNLKRDRRGNLELDFESDPNDILNPQTLELDRSMMFRPVAEPSPAYRRSLREYCSILYLKPRMKIMLRGEKVKTKLISKSLSRTEKDVYKPHFLPRPVKIIFGFSPSKMEDYGILMYHKNRLIIAYEKVGYQKQANELGVGVVGVVELNFLEPIHNKQDFNKTTQYNSCINALGVKLNEYWNEKTKGVTSGNRLMVASRPPDWLWAQCDKCLKWRRLPPTVAETDLPKKWFCHMNQDATHNRCDIPEEAEDDEDMLMRPSYEKTYKKQMEERKRLQRMEQIRQLQSREKQLQLKEEELKRMRMSMSGQSGNFSQSSASPVSTEQVDSKLEDPDLLRAHRELTEAKRRETQQTKLIEQLQQQKDLLEKKQRDVLKIAESITIKQIQDTEASNGPNQSLEFGGSGQKRPLSGEEEGSNKRVRVVTADGEVVYVVQDQPKPVIDLTLSDDESEPNKDSGENNQTGTDATPDIAAEPAAAEEGAGEEGNNPTDSLGDSGQRTTPQEEERDIKPDLDELDRRIAEAQRAMGMVDDNSETADKSADSTEDNQEHAEISGQSGADTAITGRSSADTAAEAGDTTTEANEDGEKKTDDGTEEAQSTTNTSGEREETEMETEPSEDTARKQGDGETPSERDTGIDSNVEDEFGRDFPENDDDDDDDFLQDNEAGGEEAGQEYLNAESTSDQPSSDDKENVERSQSSVSKGGDEGDSESDDKKDKCQSSGEDRVGVKTESKTESSKDVKDEKVPAQCLVNGDQSTAKGAFVETKPKLSKVVKSRGVQTLPVEIKGLLADSLNFSKLAPSEIHHLLVQRSNELEGLRKNVRELLRIILPEVDMGTPDSIDQVVQEVIRVNQTEASSLTTEKPE